MRIGSADGGAIYAGITRGDSHLFLNRKQSRRDLTFSHAKRWIKDLGSDWRLPTRREAALLYANLQSLLEDKWYWTSDPYPPDNKCMWVQTFGYGRQADLRKTDGARVCAVRTIQCE